MTPDRVLSHVFQFSKIRKFSSFFLNNMFIDYFSKFLNFENFEYLRQQFDSTVHPQPSVENHLVLSIKLFA